MIEAACMPRASPSYCRIASGRAIVHVVTNVYNLCSCCGARLLKRDDGNILARRLKRTSTAAICHFLHLAALAVHFRHAEGRYLPGIVVPAPLQVQAILPLCVIGDRARVAAWIWALAPGPWKAISTRPLDTSTPET